MSDSHFSRRAFVFSASLTASGFAGANAVAQARDVPSPSVEPIAAFRKGSRILFQGDSITDGNRGRSPDPNHILGHGYVFIIAAKHGAAFPERELEFFNRGISGDTVPGLTKRWQADTLDLKPDMLSILIGVNNEGRGLPIEDYERDYDALLKRTREANPDIRLVLCEPFTLPSGKKNERGDGGKTSIAKRQEIVARLAESHHAVHVRFQQALDAACQRGPVEHWVWDGVHPTYSGHQILADEWERTVRTYWPA